MEMTLGERIRKARKGKMTQADLANAVGVHEITVRRWELGERIPDAEALRRLSDVLGISMSELIGEGENQTALKEKVNKATERERYSSLAYWGEVADNARNIAKYGNEEEIADVSHMLERALASLVNLPRGKGAMPV